jgi:hypothetical protein
MTVTDFVIPSSRKIYGVLKNKSVLQLVMPPILAEGYTVLGENCCSHLQG